MAILREAGMPLHLRDHVLVLADCTHDADDGRVLAMWLPTKHQEATADLTFAAHVPGSARTPGPAAEGAESTAPAGVLTAVLELCREPERAERRRTSFHTRQRALSTRSLFCMQNHL